MWGVHQKTETALANCWKLETSFRKALPRPQPHNTSPVFSGWFRVTALCKMLECKTSGPPDGDKKIRYGCWCNESGIRSVGDNCVHPRSKCHELFDLWPGGGNKKTLWRYRVQVDIVFQDRKSSLTGGFVFISISLTNSSLTLHINGTFASSHASTITLFHKWNQGTSRADSPNKTAAHPPGQVATTAATRTSEGSSFADGEATTRAI